VQAPSGRSPAKAAKAASISPIVRARATWICSPILLAAVSRSRSVDSAFVIGGVDQHGNASGPWDQLAQKFQPLCHHLSRQQIDPCHVAARTGEARHET
jgi:hypothetical protein